MTFNFSEFTCGFLKVQCREFLLVSCKKESLNESHMGSSDLKLCESRQHYLYCIIFKNEGHVLSSKI